MRLSEIFTKTQKENPKDETSINAQLLERGGFVYKNSAGIYTYLPLGWRVIQKIAAIIREEMNRIGGQELFMPALTHKGVWQKTGRWDVEIAFKVLGAGSRESRSVRIEDPRHLKMPGPEAALAWTHEEVLTEIVSKFINSYKDLPFAAYQIQTKFRNEPRAKSGLLRGREFIMKDLYSFHASEDDLWKYYQDVKGAYHKIFHRCGLKAIYTVAAGGDFTVSNTHEFQVITPVGEDTIYVCSKCEYAENAEISKLKNGGQCPKCKGKIVSEKAIEVGNIFPLGTKYSEAFGLKFVDQDGKNKYVVMGSYGIGLGRVMGAVVEIHHDEKGIIWPEAVAPFKAHLIALEGVKSRADEIYENLASNDLEVVYDDREDKTAGEKFADADLIGCPIRLVVSQKTLAEDKVELKRRPEPNPELIPIDSLKGGFRFS